MDPTTDILPLRYAIILVILVLAVAIGIWRWNVEQKREAALRRQTEEAWDRQHPDDPKNPTYTDTGSYPG